MLALMYSSTTTQYGQLFMSWSESKMRVQALMGFLAAGALDYSKLKKILS